MQKFSDSITTARQRPVAGAKIVVDPYIANASANTSGVSTATIYATDGGPAVPFVLSDGVGRFSFYAADGRYNLTVTGPDITPYLLTDVTLNEPGNDATLARTKGVARISRGEAPMIIAHRGFDSIYPQNTLLAYSSAIKAGAQAIELDVCFTSDSVPYCFHDTTVDALTTGTGQFVTLSSAYIDTLRFKSLVDSRFADEPLPKFADVLAWARQNGVPIMAELKELQTLAQVDQFAQMIVDANMVGLVSAQCGYFPYLARFRAKSANLNVGFITSGSTTTKQSIDSLAALGASMLVINHDAVYADPSLVAYCEDRNVDLAVYTIPDTMYLNRVARLGVTKFMCSRFSKGTR